MMVGIRGAVAVGEVSGMVVVGVGGGMVVMENPLENMQGTDLNNIDRQTSQRGEYAETIIVSGLPSIRLHSLIQVQIMVIVRAAPTASILTERMRLSLRS